MKDGQKFKVRRTLFGARQRRIDAAVVTGRVSVNDYVGRDRPVREWRGVATVPFSPAKFKTAKKMLASTDPIRINGIGEAMVDSVQSDGVEVCIGLLSNGVFTVPAHDAEPDA